MKQKQTRKRRKTGKPRSFFLKNRLKTRKLSSKRNRLKTRKLSSKRKKKLRRKRKTKTRKLSGGSAANGPAPVAPVVTDDGLSDLDKVLPTGYHRNSTLQEDEITSEIDAYRSELNDINDKMEEREENQKPFLSERAKINYQEIQERDEQKIKELEEKITELENLLNVVSDTEDNRIAAEAEAKAKAEAEAAEAEERKRMGENDPRENDPRENDPNPSSPPRMSKPWKMWLRMSGTKGKR